MATVLEREEYIEQAYFFHIMRQRLAENVPTQEILEHAHEEVLTITRLPMAIQFLATELKHTGFLGSGFARLSHYFTPFQAFCVAQAEDDRRRFPIEICLLILEREAQYRAGQPTQPGLFVYQFEAISRNRLGYDQGLSAMEEDPFFDADWRAYIGMTRRQVGVVDFADLVYARSVLYVTEQRRKDPDYEPPVAALFGEKEGKIAKANRGRDPLYLFAALQRQLNYPEVPRPKPRDDVEARINTLKAKVRELEQRLKLVEGEVRGQVDLSQFMDKGDLLKKADDDEA